MNIGLSEILSSETGIAKCILDKTDDSKGKLNIILSGKIPNNPSELLDPSKCYRSIRISKQDMTG